MTMPLYDQDDLRAAPTSEAFMAFGNSFGRRFLLTVDTEEEFDWDAPFNRDSQAVTIANAMEAGQAFFAQAAIRPLYLADYPVIDNPTTGAMLAQWVAEGSADVGAHCHPWVNPPYEEEVSTANSFAGNLPERLEREKLTLLRDRITQVIGCRPVVFRAGRYGVGPNTGAILRDLGFLLDTSVRSGFDYSAEQGPDFRGLPFKPYRAGPEGDLVELPLSTAFTGPFGAWSTLMRPFMERGGLAASLLARSRLCQRIPLTPEGVSSAEAIRAIDHLLEEGLDLLVFSFHSPTLSPGKTPYVRSDADLQKFYRWWDSIFDHLARRNVTPVGVEEILAACSR